MTTSPVLAARVVIVFDDRQRDLLAFAITRADTVGGYPEIIVLGHFFEACSIAGALCAAFSDGMDHQAGYGDERTWRPGCGRSSRWSP